MNDLFIEYQCTLEDATRALLEATKSYYGSILKKYGKVVVGLLILFPICEITRIILSGEPTILKSPIFLALIPVYIPVALVSVGIVVLATRWQIKRAARQDPTVGKVVQWQINESELNSKTEGAETTFVWERLVNVRERKQGFLLFYQPRLASWIPKHAFSSEADVELFREIAKRHSFTDLD